MTAAAPVVDCPAHSTLTVALRPYQHDAVRHSVTTVTANGRAQLLMFCGTGKTLVAMTVAAQLVPAGGIVVVLCPTLALVAQTLTDWSLAGPAHAAMAVCSDDNVADDWTHPEDLTCPVSRDPETIIGWLRTPQTGLRLIMATHASADRVGAALAAAGIAADLTIVDEAHWTAGRADKTIAAVHSDQLFPSRLRLYATATPRVVVSHADGELETVSMDDTSVFGPVAYDYPASRAIAEGYVENYTVAVIGVPRRDVAPLLGHRPINGGGSPTPAGEAMHRAVVQAALCRAAAQYTLRRTLVFTARIAAAEAFATTLPATLAALPVEHQPAGPLTAHYVAGTMPMAQRRARLAQLTHPPGDGWMVLANSRCLAEGVNIPAIDSIVLTAKAKSTSQVVQAIGRALRPHPDERRDALVLVPILLPDDPGELSDTDAGVDAGDWSPLWQTLRALRECDDTLASELDAARLRLARQPHDPSPMLPRIHVTLPQGYQDLVRHVVARIVRSTTSSWWDGYAAAERYHRRVGNLDMNSRHIDPEGYSVGQWVNHQKYCSRNHLLSSVQEELLARLGFRNAGVQADSWEILLWHCDRYRETHACLDTPQDYRDPETGYPLGMRLSAQRHYHTTSKLRPERRAALEARGMIWDLFAYRWWNVWLAALVRYRASIGDGPIRALYRTPAPEDLPLGDWVHKQYKSAREGKLTLGQRTALIQQGLRLPSVRR